jgi:hypothetical protein
MRYWLAIAVMAGCTPSLSAGYNAYSTMSGPVSTMMTQPVATAREDPASVAPVENTRSYAVSIGGSFGKKKRMGIDVGAQLHDVNGASFSMPTLTGFDPTSPRYLLTTMSIDVRYRPLALSYVVADLHAGPAGGIVIDRGMLGYQIGQGARYGVMVAGKLGPLNAFADLYQMKIVFDDGAAKGVSTLTGLTVGLALR